MSKNIYYKLVTFTVLLLLLFITLYFYNRLSKTYFEWNNCNLLDQEKLINTYEKNGVIIIPNFFSSDDCNHLLNIVEKKENNYDDSENYTIRSLYKRKNLAIPLSECKEYTDSITNKLKYFLKNLVPNAKIKECAVFITYPGCYPQGWHSDTYLDKVNTTEQQKYATLMSLGVALEDTDETLGPLEAILGTNNLNQDEFENILKKNNIFDNYNEFYYDKNCIYNDDDVKRGLCKSAMYELLKIDDKYKYVKCSCKKGSLIIWSSRVFHRGGGNNGNKKRPIFYITLLGDNGKDPMHYNGPLEK
jgi:hypothetical protein